ncbi:alpha/beta hydrolase [Spongisporangium articulatum]|uniref:Alpha/beta hydrolase n=1 Tax=Spongisporangium articulatum TaxID=3362603 RepID=A0ABW8ARC8_9ACTN
MRTRHIGNPSPGRPVGDEAGESAPAPRLSVARRSGPAPVAAALVLHGGRSDSFAPVRPTQLAVLRVRLLAAALYRRVGGAGTAVYRLEFAVRGWNGEVASPVADARWALERIRADLGDVPVVLVGHSMGGRTALRVAGAPQVRGVVALAPWTPPGEPVAQLAGRRVLVAHGTADRITSPAQSREFTRRAAAAGADVEYVAVPGETHALLRRPRTWNGLVARGVAEGLNR